MLKGLGGVAAPHPVKDTVTPCLTGRGGEGGGGGGGGGGVGGVEGPAGGAWVGWGWGGGGANAKKTQKNAKKMQKNAKKSKKPWVLQEKCKKYTKHLENAKKNTKLMQHTVMPVLPGRRRLVAFLLHFFCICFRASAAGQHGVANILQTLSLQFPEGWLNQ